MAFVPGSEFASPNPPPLPSFPPPPPSPPANPGFRTTSLYYSIVQAYIPAGATFTLGDAFDMCQPLASSIKASLDAESTSLLPAPSSCGNGYSVVSCGYVAPDTVINLFNDWVNTNPFPENANACMQLRLARTGNKQVPLYTPPPSPPMPADPPRPPIPPPKPGPSPPPPPPCPPPIPPGGPPPPGLPPNPPGYPPSPPPNPAPPPDPPRSPQNVQVLNEMLCHPTCVSHCFHSLNPLFTSLSRGSLNSHNDTALLVFALADALVR